MRKKKDIDIIYKSFFDRRVQKDVSANMLYSDLKYKEQKRIIAKISPIFKSCIYLKTLLPQNYNDLLGKINFTVSNLCNGIGCLTTQCIHFSNEINSYLEKRKDFEKYILLGDYDRCYSILDDIDCICVSMWSLENRILLSKLKYGTKGAIDFKDELNSKVKSILSIFISFFWKNADVKYSLAGIKQELNMLIRLSNSSDEISDVLRYEFLKFQSSYKYEHLFWNILRMSIIDVYEFLLEILINSDFDNCDLEDIKACIKDLNNNVQDYTLGKLYANYSIGSNIQEDSLEHILLMNLFETKQYGYLIEKATDYIQNYPWDIDILDIYIKAHLYLEYNDIDLAFLEENCLLRKMALNLFSYLKRDSNYTVSYNELNIQLNTLSHLRIGKQLFCKLSFYEKYGVSLLHYSLWTPNIKFSDIDISESDYQMILSQKVPSFIREQAFSHLFYNFVEVDNIIDAIKIYVTAYFENKQFVRNIETKSIVKKVEEKILTQECVPLEFSIFFSLADAPNYIIYYYFKKYLFSINEKKPSDIKFPSKKISKEVEFFLLHVCTPNILSLYTRQFPTSSDVLDERLRILKQLSGIDNNNKYLTELTEITRTKTIRKRVQSLDQSMIYVDEKALKELEMDEVYKLYQSYINIDENIKTKEVSIESLEELDFNQAFDGEQDLNIKIKQVQYKYILFRQIFITIRRKFLVSYKNGLDFYLSTRIRHGTLINQLRRQFDNSHLVTNITSEGEYARDMFITNNVLRLEDVKKEAIQDILLSFTKEIDNLILSLKNEIVQVQAFDLDKQHADAIFNYDHLRFEFDLSYRFVEEISKIKDYNEFIDSIFIHLWECTDILLEKMRDYLEILKKSFILKLNKLEVDVASIAEKECNITYFSDLIATCRTGVQTDIDIVKKWFYRSKGDESDFTINDLIDACIQSVAIHRNVSNFTPEVIGSSFIVFRGEFFKKLGDLIQIFLNNIIDYELASDYSTSPIIEIKESSNIIAIEVKNKIQENDLSSLEEKLKIKKGDFLNPEAMNMTRNEKNSGLIKAYNIVRNILRYDDSAFDLNIKDNYFSVDIKIDATYLMPYENISSRG